MEANRIDEISRINTIRRRLVCGFYAFLFGIGAFTLYPTVKLIYPLGNIVWGICSITWIIVGISPGRKRRLFLIAMIGIAFTLRSTTLFISDSITYKNAFVASTVYFGYAFALTYFIIIWQPIRESDHDA